MLITNELLSCFINCQYKGYLKSKGLAGQLSEYHMLYAKLKRVQGENFQRKLSGKEKLLPKNSSFGEDIIREGTSLNVTFSNSFINIMIDGIEFLGKKVIVPVLISPFEKVKRSDKMFLALQATFIQKHFGLRIETCKVVFGQKLKETRFKLSSVAKTVRNTIAEVDKMLMSLSPPVYFKNPHCQLCEYQDTCLEKLKERDDLSLLAGMKPREILQKNNRGIFSVKQLSYTFRPKTSYRKRKYLPELKALAIRENKTFIQAIPTLKQYESEVFIDFEGILDRRSNYLIGVIIKTNDTIKEYSFWADHDTEEMNIFIQLFTLLEPLKSYVVYHYGAYETHAIKSISKQLPLKFRETCERVLRNSVNLLTLFSQTIYTPTYTNTLKEIGQFLHFFWTDKNSSGFQGTIWRYQWEMNTDKKIKDKLYRYNIEDCRALMVVVDWLRQINDDDADKQLVRNIKTEHPYKWGITNYVVKDFGEINSKAYFDYQRQHIYLRSQKKIYKTAKEGSRRIVYNKIDRKKSLFAEKCPYCNTKDLSPLKTSEKLQVDISFMRYGIKKQATLYYGGPVLCNNCHKKIRSTNMRTLPRYGYNLMIWSVNQKIQYQQSSENVINFLKDSLKIEVSATQMTLFKSQIAKRYITAYTDIILKMTKSELIHVDETIAKIKDIDGYVWVFANHDSVFYQFRETRQCDFLKELLRDFKGVLVSDFYTGYDALECHQQKCLLHLIRDLNGDFLKHQFDVELRKIVNEFGILLRSIVATIDRYGLRRSYLLKHKKDVNRFYLKVISTDFESEFALAYQKRLIRYREKLFYFLECDSIPWNNNNAEHSIKPFAKWRSRSRNLTRQNIDDHLILLSILQTCKYREINFFDFLRSRETHVGDIPVNSS